VLRQPTSQGDLEVVRQLFREYQAAIGTDLCFQGFQAEVAGLPGSTRRRAPPVVGGDGWRPVGCIALRAIDGDAPR
jgi:hypothetical protein